MGSSQRAVGEASQGLSPSLSRNEDVVSFQLLAYKDDFASERADRERAQSRIQELEEKVTSLLSKASQRQVGAGALLLPIRVSIFVSLHELQASLSAETLICW